MNYINHDVDISDVGNPSCIVCGKDFELSRPANGKCDDCDDEDTSESYARRAPKSSRRPLVFESVEHVRSGEWSMPFFGNECPRDWRKVKAVTVTTDGYNPKQRDWSDMDTDEVTSTDYMDEPGSTSYEAFLDYAVKNIEAKQQVFGYATIKRISDSKVIIGAFVRRNRKRKVAGDVLYGVKRRI